MNPTTQQQPQLTSTVTASSNTTNKDLKGNQVTSLYLYNYSNTLFQISTFYKDVEGQDYEEQVDEDLLIKPFDWYCIKPRNHQNRLMHILGVQLLDINNNINSCTFVLDELMSNMKHYWREEMLNLHDIKYTTDFNNYRQDLHESDTIFVITKRVGEKVNLYYYKEE